LSHGIQFRAEFFNLLDRANFGLPLINTAGAARQIQLGLKMTW